MEVSGIRWRAELQEAHYVREVHVAHVKSHLLHKALALSSKYPALHTHAFDEIYLNIVASQVKHP